MCFGDTQNSNEKEWFSAEEFVNNLLDEASKVPCDDTISEFSGHQIPKYYNPQKFARAQKFFEANVFALYFNKLLGLIITLASPSVLSILKMTQMSGCVMTSYRRYMATLFHMNVWYQSELSPNSRSMASIKKVKYMHNFASKKAHSMGFDRITQKDMVLTQFGFMGFAISRSELVGIHNASKEDLESFIHFWRVIGHVMGIQDRFNLCRESLEETKEICDILISRILRPLYKKKDKDFLEMTSHLLEGMWNMNPLLHYKVFLSYLDKILEPKTTNNNETNHNALDKDLYFALNAKEMRHLNFVAFVLMTLKYTLVRLFLNLQHNVSIWIMHHYPFLAVYAFGYQNAMVYID